MTPRGDDLHYQIAAALRLCSLIAVLMVVALRDGSSATSRWLAKVKMRIAEQIGSRALRADAIESVMCGYLSGIVVLGLLIQLLMPSWWWVDCVASLAIVILLVKEGREPLETNEA